MPSQITIPTPRGRIVGALGLITFVLFFVVLAVENLLNHTAMIPSILWLVLVAVGIASILKEEKGFVKFLGAFSSKHFAEVVETIPNAWDIHWGFRLAGRRLVYKVIPVGKIKSLEWSLGQASGLAGRDMNDWHVTLWYDHDDPIKCEQGTKWKLRYPDQEPYCVNYSGPKEKAAALGREVLVLLETAGAVFVQGQDEGTFIRESVA